MTAAVHDLPQPVLRKVASFLDAVRVTGLPHDVQRQGSRLVLDTVGCMVAGASASPARPLVDTFAAWSGPAIADVLGTPVRTSPADAAFVNAYTADVLDYEETLVSHPSAVVAAAGLAVGQDVGATGQQLLTAVMAGYEVGSRLGAALTPTAQVRRESAAEFWWKPVAACITTGMLLGIKGKTWADAIGYATSASPAARRGGFEFRPLSHLKANYSGQAHVGVVAAYLAARGFRTYRAMLDGPRTFAQLLGSDRWDPDILLDDLGDAWRSERIGFKAYPACLYLHALLEAIDVVRAERPFRAEEVLDVTARVPALLRAEMNVSRPANIVDAQFSAPFAAAALLCTDQPDARWLSDDRLADPTTLALAERVNLVEDDDYTRLQRQDGRVGSAVCVTLRDGSQLSAAVDVVRGSAARPLSDAELATKFVRSVTPWLGAAPAKTAADRLLDASSAASVEQLVASVRRS